MGLLDDLKGLIAKADNNDEGEGQGSEEQEGAGKGSEEGKQGEGQGKRQEQEEQVDYKSMIDDLNAQMVKQREDHEEALKLLASRPAGTTVAAKPPTPLDKEPMPEPGNLDALTERLVREFAASPGSQLESGTLVWRNPMAPADKTR